MNTKLLTMKVPVKLKDRFSLLCRQNDTSASHEIREFMKRYIRSKERKCCS